MDSVGRRLGDPASVPRATGPGRSAHVRPETSPEMATSLRVPILAVTDTLFP